MVNTGADLAVNNQVEKIFLRKKNNRNHLDQLPIGVKSMSPTLALKNATFVTQVLRGAKRSFFKN